MWSFHKSSIRDRQPQHNAPRRSRGKLALIWIERVLLVSGLALVAFYGAARLESWLSSHAALRQFASAELPADAATTVAENSAAAGSAPPAVLDLPEIDFGLWDQRRIQAYKEGAATRSQIPLAVLRIPKIHLEAPLLEGTDAITLNHAVGRIAGTSRPGEAGNIGIAGHRDGFFRGLKDVNVGDSIELQTLQGTATYIVDRIRIVSPRQVDVLQATPSPSLTLVTCYPFYFFGSAPQRYIVTASLSPEKNGEPETSNLSAPQNADNSIRRKQMKLFNKANLFGKGAGAIVLAMMAMGTAAAQDSTVTTIEHGMPSYETQVKNAEIVYVEGNDLVLKLENGRVEHLVVPDSDRFTIDGKQLSVYELVPGTRLTQTITTKTTPRYVNTVRTIEGKVWHVNAPTSVILTLPDHTNQVFEMPSHAKFTINGQQKTAFDLRKGMNIKATVVTDDEHTVIERDKVSFGQAPRIDTPREVGLLLFLPTPQPQVTLASAEEPEVLPETGSSLPLIGLLGTLGIVSSVLLGVKRRILDR